MSYFEITLGILTGIRVMVSETHRKYPLLFGAVLTIVFLIAQAVVIGFVDDPLANKMLEWLFYVSAVMCTVRLMWAALRIAIGRSGAGGSDG
jgi:hypothetical protein